MHRLRLGLSQSASRSSMYINRRPNVLDRYATLPAQTKFFIATKMSSKQQLTRLPFRGTLLSRIQVQPQNPLLQIHLLRRCRPTATSKFSTYPGRFDSKTTSNTSSSRLDSDPNNDPYRTPPVSLESLGIGKNMKIVLLAVLSLLGTIETWFWCTAIWAWWKGGEKDKNVEQGC